MPTRRAARDAPLVRAARAWSAHHAPRWASFHGPPPDPPGCPWCDGLQAAVRTWIEADPATPWHVAPCWACGHELYGFVVRDPLTRKPTCANCGSAVGAPEGPLVGRAMELTPHARLRLEALGHDDVAALLLAYDVLCAACDRAGAARARDAPVLAAAAAWCDADSRQRGEAALREIEAAVTTWRAAREVPDAR